MTFLRYALLCGAGAAVASLAATAALAKAEGQSPMRPLNASSHWLWGEEAGQQGGADVAHSVIGIGTNIGAGLFWGALFGAYLHHRRPSAIEIVRDGMAMGAVAGVLDYGILPRRLTPGWELALSNRSVVLSMAAMAAGLAAGGLAARAIGADGSTGDRSHAGLA